MKFCTLPDGNLKFVLETSDDKLLVEDMLHRNGGNDIAFMADMLEATGWQPNGRLMLVRPEEIGALTDAPILTNDSTIEDDGTVVVGGSVWWYPNYMVTHFGSELLRAGEVTFTAAPGNSSV